MCLGTLSIMVRCNCSLAAIRAHTERIQATLTRPPDDLAVGRDFEDSTESPRLADISLHAHMQNGTMKKDVMRHDSSELRIQLGGVH